MKEVTVVINAQITMIERYDDDISGEFNEKAVADALKQQINADDVVVKSAQIFMMDVEDEDGEAPVSE